MNLKKVAIGNLQDRTVRAIWLNNPYAHLMLKGKIETRWRHTNVRGLVLICSCKKEFKQDEVLTISGEHQAVRITEALSDLGQPWNGYAIAIGVLADCRPMTIEDEDKCFVQYDPKRWCWVFENVMPVKYFELKGKQGWAILDDNTKQKIEILI